VRFLLDENFPLALYHRLKLNGYEVEHLIVLGQRGLPDSIIKERLGREALVFLTCDLEFTAASARMSTIIVSRVSQSIPIARRLEIWFAALEAFLRQRPAGKVFELLQSGEVVPFERRSGSR
jgi:predicted nuclease of predicted toxin-antitoxin system